MNPLGPASPLCFGSDKRANVAVRFSPDKACAASNAAGLEQAFSQIAGAISLLRLTQ